MGDTTRTIVRELLYQAGLRIANERLQAQSEDERARLMTEQLLLRGLLLVEMNSPLRGQILAELEKRRETEEAVGNINEVLRLAQLMQDVNQASIIS